MLEVQNATANTPPSSTITINYTNLVDTAAITHSGQSLGEAIALLKASPPTRVAALRSLVEPFLEPYAFVLQDALESHRKGSRNKGLVDIGDLFPEGEPQPAWADLLRTRRLYVLSDGAGFVRMFLPGASARPAYDAHVPVIRHVIAFLLRSASTELTVEVYAYHNDLETQTLRLHFPPTTLRLQSQPRPSDATKPLNLGALAAFLSLGAPIAGASIEPSGEIVLLGPRTLKTPTIEGQRLSLADLAVAYRAVFHSGHTRAYVSLDRSPYPEIAAVNFGGRLKDTGLGWVALRSDMRFKTIAHGFDPISGDNVAAAIRNRLPDFQTQSERLFELPPGQQPAREETRFWFYPDKISVAASKDGRTATLTYPRFTADAERQAATGSTGQTLSPKTPPWTKNAIEHLNRHYELYSDMFPELAELDNVGRLLALFTWLKQRKDAGVLSLDLDVLLDVSLPQSKTPRRVPQSMFAYALNILDPKQILSYDVSPIADQWSRGRAPGGRSAWNVPNIPSSTLGRYDIEQEALLDKLAEVAEARVRSDSRSGLRTDDDIDEHYDLAIAVTGGIDLDLSKHLRALTLSEADAAPYAALLRQPAGGTAKINGAEWIRSPRAGVAPRPTPAIPHHAVADGTLGQKGDPDAATFGGGGGRRHSASGSLLAGNSWDRGSPDDPFGRGSSRTVYFAPAGSASSFSRFDGERTVKYKLVGHGTAYAATRDDTRTRPLALDISLIAKAEAAQRSDWHWQYLPEDTAIVAVDRTADSRTAILYRTTGEEELVYVDRGKPGEPVRGREARVRFDEISQARVRAASSESLQFLHVSLDGADAVIQRGNLQRRLPRETLQRVMEDPQSPSTSALDEVLGTGGDVVVYRDSNARRPQRYGGSPLTGTEADPVRVAALINERYQNTRAFLDDETALAISNRANTTPIRSKADVVGLIPDDSFNIEYRGYGNRLRSSLGRGGIRVAGSASDVGDAANVLMVTGHNDTSLRHYLVSLGTSGVLRGRILLLTTCAAPDNPELFHELIAHYGARAVLLHDQPIRPHALERVLPNIGAILDEGERSGVKVDPADLMKRAAQKALAEPGLSERLRFEIMKLVRGTLQISTLGTMERSLGAEG